MCQSFIEIQFQKQLTKTSLKKQEFQFFKIDSLTKYKRSELIKTINQ
jgi:hypothetical protein